MLGLKVGFAKSERLTNQNRTGTTKDNNFNSPEKMPPVGNVNSDILIVCGKILQIIRTKVCSHT